MSMKLEYEEMFWLQTKHDEWIKINNGEFE